MKHALLIGCGNKRGSQIVLGCKEAGYSVINIGSSASEINDVQSTFCLLSTTHQEVIRFDVSVQMQVFVHHLDADQQLLAQHAHSFQAEFMVALNVVSLERFAEQL